MRFIGRREYGEIILCMEKWFYSWRNYSIYGETILSMLSTPCMEKWFCLWRDDSVYGEMILTVTRDYKDINLGIVHCCWREKYHHRRLRARVWFKLQILTLPTAIVLFIWFAHIVLILVLPPRRSGRSLGYRNKSTLAIAHDFDDVFPSLDIDEKMRPSFLVRPIDCYDP